MNNYWLKEGVLQALENKVSVLLALRYRDYHA